ncbi:MAG: hypothetical protein BWY82_03028 [Verrucomicrobia bacterium ADurb.Bin474]|nr:MAG: hypothetical protein BWY82_03028 [Verrucomicrobia bacterium ADurb.Bin474]
MIRVSEYHGGVSFAAVLLDLPCDNSNIGTGGVFEIHAEVPKILAAFGRYAMGSHHHDRIGLLRLRKLDSIAALVVANLPDPLCSKGFHHLAVVDEGTIREYRLVFRCCEFSCDADRTIHSPAETSTFCPNDFHEWFECGWVRLLRQIGQNIRF